MKYNNPIVSKFGTTTAKTYPLSITWLDFNHKKSNIVS